ncbi:hypothetical protein HK11_06565 [Acetobacter sp. DmW_043]|uniref:DUF3147 family protein n=1 Tax=Acetobacter sp. DmW_043 TaxID=1670658 RepID=UPI000A36B06C|nr:DUF3147 family protein [Acetobacter sp. DmW_043]OUI88461.1 hypothetical protein HK11_06565 [Acetobacter sp. DmW_043]
MFFLIKVILSGLIVAIVSGVAKRYPAFGALIASLPFISILGMIWLWTETHDADGMKQHTYATFWYILPSLPMFLFVPWLMEKKVSFYPVLLSGCLLTIVLYVITAWGLSLIKPIP